MTRLIYLLPALLMACAPVPDVIDPIPLDAEVEVPSSSGLEERLPDTCKLADFQGFVGQPISSVVLPVEANTRVVEPGEILSQIYVADRVNFYVDEEGVITRVICG